MASDTPITTENGGKRRIDAPSSLPPRRLSKAQRSLITPSDKKSIHNLWFECGGRELFEMLVKGVSDTDCRTIAKADDFDPAILFYNINHLVIEAGNGDDPWANLTPGEVRAILHELALALRSRKGKKVRGMLPGRLLSDHTKNLSTVWSDKYAQELMTAHPDFASQLAALHNAWPKALLKCINTLIPSDYFPSLVVNMSKPLVSEDLWLHPEGDYPSTFVEKVARFLVTWNLQAVSIENGQLVVEPAQVWCACDINAQGTYVFVPRYFNWSRVKNEDHGDFAAAKDLVDTTFAKFAPPRRPRQATRMQQCMAFIESAIGSRERSEQNILNAVDNWLRDEKIGSHSQRTKYRNGARKHFRLHQ